MFHKKFLKEHDPKGFSFQHWKSQFEDNFVARYKVHQVSSTMKHGLRGDYHKI